MRKIVLISCVSKKLDHPARAEELYTSTLFKYGLKYAKSFNPDRIFILSAKYGLVSSDKIIAPYNKTLNDMSSKENIKWSNKVLEDLKKVCDLDNDQVIFLAGENYRKYLLPHIKNYAIPMKGLGIGRQLKYLKDKTSKSSSIKQTRLM